MLTEARFIKPAEIEFNEAADFYDAEQPGLGVSFSECVEATLLRAMHFPGAGSPSSDPRLRSRVRRFQVDHPFPYDLIVTVLEDELVVIAVAHHSREPDYWSSRMKKLQR